MRAFTGVDLSEGRLVRLSLLLKPCKVVIISHAYRHSYLSTFGAKEMSALEALLINVSNIYKWSNDRTMMLIALSVRPQMEEEKLYIVDLMNIYYPIESNHHLRFESRPILIIFSAF